MKTDTNCFVLNGFGKTESGKIQGRSTRLWRKIGKGSAKMIDCSKTENYLTIKLRLCKIGCNRCPLSFVNNDKKISCEKFETQYHQRAIELIQKWSDEHTQKTFLTDDIQKVVRCKDCIYFSKDTFGQSVCTRLFNQFCMNPDDFCSYGKQSK